MRKIASVVIIASFMTIGCGDKIQQAKISSAAIKAGAELALTGLNAAIKERARYCLDIHKVETSDEYKKCYNVSNEVKSWNFYNRLYPQVKQAVKTLDAAIATAEAKRDGEFVDLITPMVHGVCLLAKVVEWLPLKWRKPVQAYINMVGYYTCGSKASINSQYINLENAKKIRDLLLMV